MRVKLISLLMLATFAVASAYAQEQAMAEAVDTQTEAELEAAEASAEKPDYPIMDYNRQRKYIIRDIKVYGVDYADPEFALRGTGLKKGDEVYIPGNYISTAINRLWMGTAYSDIDVKGDIVGDSLDLHIYLSPRPLVTTWTFEGVRRGEASTLKEELGITRTVALSDFLIEKNSKIIRDHFIGKGFRNVDVGVRITGDPAFDNDTRVMVTFLVDKGSKVKIGDITFSGNETFSDRRLRRTFSKTSKKSINIFKGFKLNEKEYATDKILLIDFYNSKGYRNANILSDSIYNINDRRIGLHIDLEEGNQYFYRNIDWVGNSIYSTEQLNSLLRIESGDTYDRKTLHKRLGIGMETDPDDMTAVSSLYQNDGYIFSSIDPAETIIGADSIDLQIKVFEGKQATINEVGISGNIRINDEVIRRELYTYPGELYDRSLLMQTMRMLGQINHFNPETIMPDIQSVSNEKININWPLEEQASDQVEISGGWGAGMFVGSVGLQLNNFSISDVFKKGAWRPYPHGQNQKLSLRAQTNGRYYKAFSASFMEPWLGGKKPNSLSVSAYFSEETGSYYVWQSSNKHFRTLGVSAGLGRRLRWPDQYFTLYNEVSYQSYNLKDWDYFIISNGSSNIFTFTTVFGRSSVDQTIYPRTGSDFSLSLALTPPYSLFDNKDYSDPDMSDNDRYRWIEYHKWLFKAQWFYPISNNNKLILMAKAEMGYLGSYNKDKQSPFEGFNVGGDGMSGYTLYGVDIIGLRGYENSSITPSDYTGDYARAYNKYTVELRYPVMLQPSSTIYGLVFAEGGNAFSGWETFNPFQLKRSVGIGVRVYLPIVGMLGVDWGYGFDKVPGSNKRSGGQIHYMIGQQF